MAASKFTRPHNDVAAARFARETKPRIDPSEPEAIEQFLSANGPCRRVATVFLSRPWRSMAKNVAESRESAVSLAAVFLALEESRANYFTVAAYLEDAYERLRAALQRRPDFDALLEEAERQLAEPEVLQ